MHPDLSVVRFGHVAIEEVPRLLTHLQHPAQVDHGLPLLEAAESGEAREAVAQDREGWPKATRERRLRGVLCGEGLHVREVEEALRLRKVPVPQHQPHKSVVGKAPTKTCLAVKGFVSTGARQADAVSRHYYVIELHPGPAGPWFLRERPDQQQLLAVGLLQLRVLHVFHGYRLDRVGIVGKHGLPGDLHHFAAARADGLPLQRSGLHSKQARVVSIGNAIVRGDALARLHIRGHARGHHVVDL
mmetsp:Transcript_22248/g.51994  ORF Transcript_22248/g.51994 Transcript_22248/m.51994 type:complete len:244 (-) Transcript_22248:63-794(-)